MSNLGLYLYNNKKYEEALLYFDNALKLSPLATQLLKYKADSLQKLTRYEDAIQSYNKVLDTEPQNIEALYEKGKILYELQKYEEAINWYDKALQIEPDNTNVKQNREIALESIKTQKFLELINVIEPQYKKKNYSDVINLSNKAIEIILIDHLSYLYKGFASSRINKSLKRLYNLMIMF